MNLLDFMFPICERPVAIHNGNNDITDLEDYKAIGREDTIEPIGVFNES
jgi:hypothetical protein